jgi:hypothetical protein
MFFRIKDFFTKDGEIAVENWDGTDVRSLLQMALLIFKGLLPDGKVKKGQKFATITTSDGKVCTFLPKSNYLSDLWYVAIA